ncbi:MAG TPA: HAD-IIB family hydrolase, partial [Paracoccaceae bacterium]
AAPCNPMTRPTPIAKRRWLVISDVDDTLTGDAGGLQALAAALARHRRQLWFALNSSRPFASVARTLRKDFPDTFRPDAAITALGTEIRLDGALCAQWDARFGGWPRDQIFDLLLALGHRPHDDEFQTPRKVSFAVSRSAQAGARTALAERGIPCRIIASGTDDFDVIPPGAGKDAAALFLAEALGASRRRLVVAGDSGNDLAMFRIAAHAIAVGNARPELLDAMPTETTYHARQPYAFGVLEGLVHFGVLPA